MHGVGETVGEGDATGEAVSDTDAVCDPGVSEALAVGEMLDETVGETHMQTMLG